MSKFNIWVDDSHLNNVMGYDEFVADTQRTAGFTGGTPASSVRVNSALRQANLVACALMNIVDPGNTVDFRSSVNSIQSLISTYLTTTLKTSKTVLADRATLADKATNADINNLNTGDNAVVNFKIGNGTSYNKTVDNVRNATNCIAKTVSITTLWSGTQSEYDNIEVKDNTTLYFIKES